MKYEAANAFNKPVLDQETFRQLLAAAYTLQTQIDRERVKDAKLDSRPSVSRKPEPRALPLVMFPPAQSDVEQFASPNHLAAASAAHSFHRKIMRARTPRNDELFWRIAKVAAMAAVSALVLVASVNRLSPLPAGLEERQQGVPFRKGVVTKAVMIEPRTTNILPVDLISDSDEPSESALAQKMTKNPTPRASHDRESDMVAQDTVVRYGKGASLPRLQIQPKP